MPDTLSTLPSDGETIAELRELYRAAEARSARLRLLSVSGRELAAATSDTLDEIVKRCAMRLAFFVGCRAASVREAEKLEKGEAGIPIQAPGEEDVTLAWLVVDGLERLADISDPEDREAFRMELEQMGLAIDRIRRERERADLVSALQSREKTLAMLLERIFTAQEEERRRVSHELHDGVAQTATALVRILDNPAQRAKLTDDADEGAINPADVARSLVSELRRVIAGLRPTMLDDLGLLPALQALGEGLEADGYRVTQTLVASPKRLSPLVETAVFRVAQEAVANIRKHAGAPCDVLIEARFDTDPLTLRIEDHGEGPSEETRKAGAQSGNNVGIEVMKERMSAIGGTLEWGAGAERGVFVEARLPAEN
ncbi:histidine kinase [Erythrobacter sp. SCSIO 43205]|uniref:sensor histidine kinase n=1 Tax=Erythrobacter sp. SCSIO 43205 TaxID=2779361 RepID=UPI001CAA2A0B|nr:ATP-binding protein [Erythrobacter sp. SCSIO 43205]UAB77645.1 histidine kinase [Erythrobacter sp. SCSIO 43205]